MKEADEINERDNNFFKIFESKFTEKVVQEGHVIQSLSVNLKPSLLNRKTKTMQIIGLFQNNTKIKFNVH